jgi:hypothetical protein
MAIKLARFVNLSGRRIEFVKGVSGVPWPGCDADPEGVIEAPASYADACVRAGFTPMTPEMERAHAEDAELRALIAKDEAEKAEAEARAKAAAEAALAEVEAAAAALADVEAKAKADDDEVRVAVDEPAPVVESQPTSEPVSAPAPKGKHRGRRN